MDVLTTPATSDDAAAGMPGARYGAKVMAD